MEQLTLGVEMDLIKLKVSNIKNIKSADIELPMEGGVYSLVGGNGSGKSTLMLLLSVIVSSRRYSMLQLEDFDKTSELKFRCPLVEMLVTINGKSVAPINLLLVAELPLNLRAYMKEAYSTDLGLRTRELLTI